MNDYSQLNNEQIESRLAHISVEETITPEFEVPIFNSSKLWDLLGEIHREVDEQISACAKINDQIDEKILRRYWKLVSLVGAGLAFFMPCGVGAYPYPFLILFNIY